MPIYLRARPERPLPSRYGLIMYLLNVFGVLVLLCTIVYLLLVHRPSPSSASARSCLDLMRSTDYTEFVALQPDKQQMAAVQFVDQLMGGAPAALVSVTNSNAQASLDIYVYGCSVLRETPTLTLLWKQQGLIQGSVEVSDANTLVIGERDSTISQENSVLLQPLQQYVYQEYRWNQNHFMQVAFPGLYPVTNRSGAGRLQAQANSGQLLPWSDPLVTAEQMGRDILHWTSINAGDTLLDNDGRTAHVLLLHDQPALRITVTLKRLLQSNQGGLWFVTDARTPAITLDQTAWQFPLRSPVSAHGTINPQSMVTSVLLLDHTYSPVPLMSNPSLVIGPGGTYSASIAYVRTLPNQQGIVLIEGQPTTAGAYPGQLLLTGVILS